jgi:hypothetical protein
MTEINPEVFYPPGAMFLTTIGGRTGWWVAFGQLLAGRPSRWTHAGIIGPDGTTFEAAPGGVHKGTVDDLLAKPHIISDAPIKEAAALVITTTVLGARQEQEKLLRASVVFQANLMIDTPYSFFDYVALASLHVAPKARFTKWARERVKKSRYFICSAMCDEVYRRAGIHLFSDGRYPGDVMPADLDWWITDHKRSS